ncbi:alpha-glucosidase-like [Chelonus insularis]|uniref:alpha-glucosidase-like n=1 Tax=Chelonus insularis TaxID=460826 RepID=UPI00158C1C25|nr:alpha-glucosidase-like [Chelonus insularis]
MSRKLVLLVALLPIIQVYSANVNWWEDTFIYQVYPRSFKDSNGDGIGDLNGITSKLEHLKALNVSGFWISPIFVSPMVDFGYDIANFTDIDPTFGTLKDFSALVAKAKSLNLKVILDFVPNHSSDKHPWFQKSIQRIKPFDDYYVWRDAKMVNGTRHPPNNWLSVFHGSGWTWNEQRKQYYFHQFTPQQPDLNYRSPALYQAMKDVLTFWTDRGVDGFRVDAIIHVFEDARFLDEPAIPNTGLPVGHYETLNHIYTRNQNETYTLVNDWRKHLDSRPGGKKILMTESYTGLQTLPSSMKYYTAGADVPFNFMLISNLNNRSTPLDFKRAIDGWLNIVPAGYQANWVVDNHDNNRATTRFGRKRADQIIMLAAILPGVGVIYYGNEIGMEDTWLSWNETVDPVGCNAGPEKYYLTSRDPERTPMQWNNSTSAGFSTNKTTWLRVNPNYKTLNLAAQLNDKYSHYSVFKRLVDLKMSSKIKNASTEVIIVGEHVLGVRRKSGNVITALLINFRDLTIPVYAAGWMNLPEIMTIYTTNHEWMIPPGSTLNTTLFNIPPSGSIILQSNG